MEVKGKRLLILGGSLWKDAIKRFCVENEIVIIAAGNDPSSGICDIADEYYNVNSTDSDEMKKLIVEKRIDGVYMGGNEPVINAACQYINELGLPCYCNKYQWDSMQNKVKFKELCIKFGLPVARRFEYADVLEEDYPVVTKPADGCASNGFTICRNADELRQGYTRALECSPTGSVIVEQYVPNDAVGVIYTISKGRIIFSTIQDKYPVFFSNHGTYVGGLFDFESKFKDEFRQRFEDKLQKLIDYLGIKEGNFWIEVFHSDEKFFFNEAGFRYGGSGTLYPVDYFSGINQVAADIYYALTGTSKIEGFSPLYGSDVNRGYKYAVYPVFLKAGKIGRIDGVEQLLKENNLLNVLHMHKEGYSVPDNGSFNQIVLLVHFIYNGLEELKSTVRTIHELLTITDDNGADMILKMIDIDSFKLKH